MSLNLYLTGLPLSWTTDKLYDVFNSIGPVASGKVLIDMTTKQSRGIGFVKYVTQEHANTAIQTLNGRSYEGHTITVKYAANKPSNQYQTNQSNDSTSSSPHTTPRQTSNRRMSPSRMNETMNDQSNKSSSPSNEKDVYLACFPQSFTSSDLVRLCSPFGKCTAKLLTDPTTGKSRGCGFVKFARIEDAHSAIAALNGSILEGCNESRPLQARFAARKNHSDHHQQISPQLGYHALNLHSSHQHINPAPLMAYDMSINPALPLVYPMSPSAISFDLLNHSLTSPFSMGLGSPTFFPYPDFMYYPAAGRPLLSPTNTTTMPNASSEALTLFVCNLPSSYMEVQLSSLFGAYGHVTQARIVRGPQGESRGFGFVTFSNEAECVHAINSLNGLPIDASGKPLHVAWRRPSNFNQSKVSNGSHHAEQMQSSSPQPSESDCSSYVAIPPDSPDPVYQQSTIVA